jgi:peptide/nickel transport system substrate-binding protein
LTANRTRRSFLRLSLVALGSAGTLLAACAPPAPAAPTATPPSAAKPTAAAAAPTSAAKPTAAAQVPPPTAAAQPTTAPAAAPAKSTTPAGRLTLAQGIDPRSLWGNSSTAQQEINVSEQITEKLIEFNTDATDYEPRLATEWKQLDQTNWQFKLRQGIKFTNGEDFDANSAKFSIDVMLQAPAYAAFVGVIAGASVVDKYTLNVQTKNPTLLHLPALCMGSFQYPAAYFQQVGQDEFGRKPIGTGPYRFVEWVKDSHVNLEANDGYWNGAAAIKSITFRNIPEGAAKLAALERGEVDFMIDVPLDAVERVERNTDLQLFSRPSNRIFYVMTSVLSDSPLKNPKVRQALWYAIDVDSLIRGLFKGRANKLEGQVLSPSFFGFSPTHKAKGFDPDRAKQMLAEAGYPDGFEITFKYPAGRYVQDKEAGQAIAAQLTRVGVRTRQEVLEPGTFLTQLSGLQLNDMSLGGFLPPPDAHFMYQQFNTGFSYSYYANKEWDDLVAKGATTTDREERLRIYQQIADLAEKDPPFVPLYYPNDIYAGNKKVQGFTPRASQFLDLRALRLS